VAHQARCRLTVALPSGATQCLVISSSSAWELRGRPPPGRTRRYRVVVLATRDAPWRSIAHLEATSLRRVQGDLIPVGRSEKGRLHALPVCIHGQEVLMAASVASYLAYRDAHRRDSRIQ